MIQALTLTIIGPQTSIFGDGPDGGREATFDGQTQYQVGETAWEGHGVVQAKFLQRPVDTQHDGQWALTQLEAELQRLASRPSSTPLDYYIFATNVVLTPVATTGSKDKVISLLSVFAKECELKGFDIWDSD